jgi:pteridine reductase
MPRRAIVIGAARRVGRAVALEFARAGWDLVLTYRSRQAEALTTAAEARWISATAGGSASVRVERLELSDLAAVERFGRAHAGASVDALVLSAAAYSRTPFGVITAATAESELRINAVAPLLLVQALAPALACSSLAGGGSVIAFGDIHAMGRPRRAFAPYLMSKAAIHCMVESLALELGPAVRVNAVAPGVVAWPDDAPAEERAAYDARIPLARPGTPEDAARMVRSITEDMPYVTGSVFRLDGGRWLR